VEPTAEAHRPVRTCLGCRTRRDAGTLVRARIGSDGRGQWAGSAARISGRGAWICADSLACFDAAARRGGFAKAWRSQVDSAVVEDLRASYLHEMTKG